MKAAHLPCLRVLRFCNDLTWGLLLCKRMAVLLKIYPNLPFVAIRLITRQISACSRETSTKSDKGGKSLRFKVGFKGAWIPSRKITINIDMEIGLFREQTVKHTISLEHSYKC